MIYLPGVVAWRIDRDKMNRGQVLKIIGSDIHKQLTVHNPNTMRKLYALIYGLIQLAHELPRPIRR